MFLLLNLFWAPHVHWCHLFTLVLESFRFSKYSEDSWSNTIEFGACNSLPMVIQKCVEEEAGLYKVSVSAPRAFTHWQGPVFFCRRHTCVRERRYREQGTGLGGLHWARQATCSRILVRKNREHPPAITQARRTRMLARIL